MEDFTCKRRFERVERALVTYYRKAGVEQIERAALAQNVSFGGLFVEMEDDFAPGDLLELEIVLEEGSAAIEMTAVVVRREGGSLALEFKDIADADRARLQLYLLERYT